MLRRKSISLLMVASTYEIAVLICTKIYNAEIFAKKYAAKIYAEAYAVEYTVKIYS